MRYFIICIHSLMYSIISLPLIGYGQHQQLFIGEKIEDHVFNNVLNYKDSILNMADYKGKYVIFDFWNKYCLSCIQAFPKIDSLQKNYSNQLQFILVNKDDILTTTNFFSKRPQIKIPEIPLITTDTILHSLFPVEGYPYGVWIDSNMMIRYITKGHNITPEHVKSFINAEPIDVDDASIKRQKGSLFEYNKSNVFPNPGYYSYISNCIKDLHVGFDDAYDISDTTIRISSNCSSIVDLYKKAYSKSDHLKFRTPGTIILEVKEPMKFLRPADHNVIDRWSRFFSYNYELVIPNRLKDHAYEIMQQDLWRFFGLHVIQEKRTLYGNEMDILIIKE